MSLKNKVVSGVKWTSLSTIIVAILQVLQVSVLAHFLLPSDFGLMAIVMVVIGFSQVFSDMGISNAIIHHQDISHEELSSLYWLNIIIAVLLFFIMSVLSPLISQLYEEPLLSTLIIILSFNFVLLSFGNQYRILLQKNLQFNTISKIEIFSTFFSVIVAILLAVYEYGVYSLVYASLVKSAFLSLFYNYVGLKEYKPSLLFKLQYIKPFLSFGMYRTGQSILNYFNSQFDVLLIGKLLGSDVLGVYSIMKQLAIQPLQLIGSVVTKVTFPMLAKRQNNVKELKNIYLKTIHYITFITFPVYILIFALSEPIILIMFGEKWLDYSNILQILAIFFMLKSTGNSIGALVMATGKVNLEFWWNVGMFIVFPISIYIGSLFSLEGVAISLVILRFLTIILMWYYMIKPIINATFSEYVKSFLKSMLFSIVASTIAYTLISDINTIINSLIYSFIMLSIYLILNYKFGINILTFMKVEK